jgi:DNA-binding GntR family transcriptional regulator
LAAINALPSEIDALASAVASAEAAATLGDLPKLVMTKQRVRSLVGEISRNETLANMLLPLQLKTSRFWIYSMAQNRLEDRLAEIRHYHAVVEGIAQHNPARASEAMSALLARFPEDIKRFFSPAATGSWGNRAPLHGVLR